MTEVEGGIENMALGYNTFGCHALDDGTFVSRQWAPGAEVNNMALSYFVKIWL